MKIRYAQLERREQIEKTTYKFARNPQKWDCVDFETVLPSNLYLDQQTLSLDTHSLYAHRGQRLKRWNGGNGEYDTCKLAIS